MRKREHPRDDGDVEVVGERGAQLVQQVCRRLDARPVVLVENEQPWTGIRTGPQREPLPPIRRPV